MEDNYLHVYNFIKSLINTYTISIIVAAVQYTNISYSCLLSMFETLNNLT